MKTAFWSVSGWIAQRYLISKNKTSFISIISWLALIGIAIGFAALIIIMSVFNGLEDLNKSLFTIYDADLTIVPSKGKSFLQDPTITQKLNQNPKIAYYYTSLEENVLVKYAGEQTVGKLKGVSNNFLKNKAFQSAVVEGQAQLFLDSIPQAIVGVGIQQNLLINIDNILEPIEFLYPKSTANINNLGEGTISSAYCQPSSVFSIETSYDQHIIVPLTLCQKLFEKAGKISAIEIALKNPKEIEILQQDLEETMGENYKIQTREQKHAAILRAIKTEKLFVFIALTAITCIVALNLYFAISMMIIEKKENLHTLKTIGFTGQDINKIFMSEGFIITTLGTTLGLILGVGLSFLQQVYGFVKMGTSTSLIDYYPIRLEFTDILYGFLGIFLIGLLAGYLPAREADRMV